MIKNGYYPFGMAMPGRQFAAASGYRYGFNGKEKDKDISEGAQDYGMRIYDRRLGRFLSEDPLTKDYPFYSPYQFAGNMPIKCSDLDGGEPQDRIENWKGSQMIINDTRRSNAEVEYTPAMGVYSYEAVYDQVSEKYWFVMRDKNDGSYSYWKHNAGADPTLLRQSTTGKLDNGHWEIFETKNSIDARTGVAVANLFAKGFATLFVAPFAIGGYTGLSAIAGTTYVGRGIFDMTTDAAGQLATNGGSIKDVNRTSLVLSFLVPGNNIRTLLAKNAVANYAKWDGKGYAGIGSEGYGGDDFLSDALKTGVGTIFDKTFSVLGNRSVANPAQLKKWTNLNYKSTYFNLLQQNSRNIKMNSFFNSWQGKFLGSVVNNVSTNTGDNSTPTSKPTEQLGFH